MQNYKLWEERILNRKSSQSKRQSSANEELTLAITNPRLTGTGNTPWFEFDVEVSSSDPVYFDNCLMRIAYNTTAFGKNVVANGNIQITRGADFNTSSYTDPQSNSIDQTNSVIGVPFGVTVQGGARAAISTAPKKLLHIRMKIKKCDKPAEIEFVDQSFLQIFSFFTHAPSDPVTATVSFPSTTYSGSIQDNTCTPIITGFNDNVPAGIGATLTINGRYFGPDKGNGTVVFKNANIGTYYSTHNDEYSGIDDYDVISWQDDEIKIKLPAITKGLVSDATNPNYQPIPGTGNFLIRNKFESIGESGSKLTIPYAVHQETDLDNNFQFIKVVPKLSGQNATKGYTIHLTTNLVNTFPNIKPIVRRAVKDWSCTSGIDWTLGNDTNLTAGPDGVCVIDAVTSAGALQETKHEFKKCINTNPWEYTLKAFDILINASKPWQLDTIGDLAQGKYDMYHAISHELGHGHLIGHINDSVGDLMFWGANKGHMASNLRKRVWFSSGASDGADYVTVNLVGGVPNCFESHVLSFPVNCSGLSVKEEGDNLDIETYPNPIANGDLHIKFSLKQPTNTHFFLYDSGGKLMKYTEADQSQHTTYSLSVEELPKGIYFLQVIAGSKRQTVKFIKE